MNKMSVAYKRILNSEIWPVHVQQAIQKLIEECEAEEKRAELIEAEAILESQGYFVELVKRGKSET